MNFMVLWLFAEVFLQNLTNSQKFSPSKVYRYTVLKEELKASNYVYEIVYVSLSYLPLFLSSSFSPPSFLPSHLFQFLRPFLQQSLVYREPGQFSEVGEALPHSEQDLGNRQSLYPNQPHHARVGI